MMQSYRNLLSGLLRYNSVSILSIIIGIFLVFPTICKATPATDSLNAYWKLDGNINDSSGHASTGAIVGATNFATVTPPSSFDNTQSLMLTGTTNYFRVPSPSAILSIPGDMTFSFWYNLAAAPDGVGWMLAGNYDPLSQTTPQGFYFRMTTGSTIFSAGNGADQIAINVPDTTVLMPGNWHLLTGTWNQSSREVRLYIDGVLRGTSLLNGNLAYDATEFRFGGFTGRIDEVRLYNRTLSNVEINTLYSGNHLTTTWNGANGSNYEDLNNWSPPAVPDLYSKVSINNTTNTPLLTSGEAMSALTINNGATLNLDGFSIQFFDCPGSNCFANNGTLILRNETSQALTNFTNDTDSGTVQINGTANRTGFATGSSYFNLTINNQPSVISTLTAALVVHNDLRLQSGNLDATTMTINVGGDWLNSGGVFNPGTSTVNLVDGPETTNTLLQNIYGSNNFYNLTKITNLGIRLGFQADSTQQIQGTLTLQGPPSGYMNLRSTNPGVQWRINPQGTRNLNRLDVRDSVNINGTQIDAVGTDFVNTGNNTNWRFETTAPAITLSALTSPTPSKRPAFHGLATEGSGTIMAVEYALNESSPVWIACSADNGVFDEQIEYFTCQPITDLADGTHNFIFRSRDTDLNETSIGEYPAISVTVDSVAPDIAAIVESPGSYGATISWNTSEPAISHVQYGKTTTYVNNAPKIIPTTMTLHNLISINNLEKCTTYHYRLLSKDIAGNLNTTLDRTFKTADCDTTSSDNSSNDDDDDDDDSSDDTSDDSSDDSSDSSDDSSSSSNQTETTDNDENESTTTTRPISQPTSPAIKPPAPEPFRPNYNGVTTEQWQERFFGKPVCFEENVCGGLADPDHDGLTNNDEFRMKTDPNQSDSDGDGAADSQEVESGRNPAKASRSEADDEIVYESAKEHGQVEKDTYQVHDVELVEKPDGEKAIKFTGKALPNSYVTLYVYSDLPTVITVKTDADGNWAYIMDKDLEEGEHQVYVAVTDNTGKVVSKSEPLGFIKTAQAITRTEAAGSAVATQISSPLKKNQSSSIKFIIAIVATALLLALVGIKMHLRGQSKNSVPGDPNLQI